MAAACTSASASPLRTVLAFLMLQDDPDARIDVCLQIPAACAKLHRQRTDSQRMHLLDRAALAAVQRTDAGGLCKALRLIDEADISALRDHHFTETAQTAAIADRAADPSLCRFAHLRRYVPA